jgi:hypothetical protein
VSECLSVLLEDSVRILGKSNCRQPEENRSQRFEGAVECFSEKPLVVKSFLNFGGSFPWKWPYEAPSPYRMTN